MRGAARDELVIGFDKEPEEDNEPKLSEGRRDASTWSLYLFLLAV